MALFRTHLIGLLFLVFQMLFKSICFAQPSEIFLMKLSKNAVDFRRNHLPTLLTGSTRSSSFKQVIENTLNDLQKEKAYRGFESDQSILECFLRIEQGGNSKGCDGSVKKLTKHLL